MKRILVTGSNGQIGAELIPHLRKLYGAENVLATDLQPKPLTAASEGGPSQTLDVLAAGAISDTLKRFRPDTIFHMAGVLSAKGEANPKLAWDVNVTGSYVALELAREYKTSFFFPSSIAAFGPSTPHANTPQDTIQRPSTMYGVAKVTMELLCDYYHLKYGLDTRGVRFPGLISYAALPGGGTTDYAVHIYYEALKTGRYTSYIGKGTFMDMMYMPDALDAVVKLMEADPAKLVHRNSFNITAMSFDPEGIAASIRKHIPGFAISYDVDPMRQAIADSWPDSLDCSAARKEWGFEPKYDIDRMTADMLARLKERI